MKLNKVVKNNREILYGTGTHEEVESLNVAKDFETALNVLGKIRTARKGFFCSNEPARIDRNTHGRRKTS